MKKRHSVDRFSIVVTFRTIPTHKHKSLFIADRVDVQFDQQMCKCVNV